MGALDELLGPMLLGLTLNALLFGALLVQYYIYYTGSYRRDSIGIKLVVSFLMIADAVNFVLDLTFVWMYTVSHFGDFDFIQTSNWVFNTDPVMTVIISSTVQSFFAWRVRVLTGHRWLYFLLNLSSVIQFLCGLGTTIGCSIVKEFVKFQSFQSVVIVWLTLSAATDIVIAGVMVQYLRNHRTGIPQTEDVITKLVRFTIQTGLITSVWAIADLIIYLSLTNNLHLVFNMALSKLYSGACLSSLNARTVWTSESSHMVTDMDRSPPSGGINIMTTSTTHHDNIELDDSYTHDSFLPLPASNRHHGHGHGAAHNIRMALTPRRASRATPTVISNIPHVPRERDLGVKMGQLDYDEYVNGISLHERGTPSPIPREKKYAVEGDDEVTSPSTLVSVEYPRSERSESDRTIVIGREKR